MRENGKYKDMVRTEKKWNSDTSLSDAEPSIS